MAKKYDHLIPKVDEELCTGCGTCIAVCPTEVFELNDDLSKVVKPDECIECEACIENCPEDAIELVEE